MYTSFIFPPLAPNSHATLTLTPYRPYSEVHHAQLE